MFLDEAHRAARYYAALKAQIGTAIFNAAHRLDPYYPRPTPTTSSSSSLRNQQPSVTYKPARYHLLMAFRHMVGGEPMPARSRTRSRHTRANWMKCFRDDAAKASKVFRRRAKSSTRHWAAILGFENAVKVLTFTDQSARRGPGLGKGFSWGFRFPGMNGEWVARPPRTLGGDDANRTRVASLEDWGSTIELRHPCAQALEHPSPDKLELTEAISGPPGCSSAW